MSASDRVLGDLIDEVNEGRLVVRPPFQRRLVWTNKDKEFFIDTVLKGFPFPEIFICTGESDSLRSTRKTWLVDGQQRITTLRDYVKGSPNILCKTVPKYADLNESEREQFLETTVAVRDLKKVTGERLKEIFTRINSTNYMLKAMEVRHALFSGAYKQYCDALSSQPFFVDHKVFPEGRKKRMEDLAFCVILVTTLLGGYYQRDSKNEEYLERYNEDFPSQDKIQVELDQVFDFIERCQFAGTAPIWRLTNLFTLIVELHQALVVQRLNLTPDSVGKQIEQFFEQVARLSKKPTDGSTPETHSEEIFRYWKAAKTAANDKHSRVQRAEIISRLISNCAASSAAPKRSQGKKIDKKTTTKRRGS
ncbi:MAG: DUF262 domain-containing protein [Planctomycetota bacterium]